MPLPVFRRETALLDADPDAKFAITGVEAADLLIFFGMRNWYIWTLLHLCSDASGLVEIGLREICVRLGLNRETVQAGLREIDALRIDGKRVLRIVRSTKFGKNRYVLFPERPDAPLADVPDPAPRRRSAPAVPPPASPAPLPPAPPTSWAVEPDAGRSGKTPLLDERDEALARSGKTPLLEGSQEAEKPRFLDGSQEAEKPRFFPIDDPDRVDREETDLPDPSDPGRRPKRRTPPVRNTENPENAADLVALFIALFTNLKKRKPAFNEAGFGTRMKRAISDHGVEKAADAIRFYFEGGHRWSRQYAERGHAGNWLIVVFEEVVAASEGRTEDLRRLQEAAGERRTANGLQRLRAEAEAAGASDHLPAHLRALCDDPPPPAPLRVR